jgi:hypothetical protein
MATIFLHMGGLYKTCIMGTYLVALPCHHEYSSRGYIGGKAPDTSVACNDLALLAAHIVSEGIYDAWHEGTFVSSCKHADAGPCSVHGYDGPRGAAHIVDITKQEVILRV